MEQFFSAGVSNIWYSKARTGSLTSFSTTLWRRIAIAKTLIGVTLVSLIRRHENRWLKTNLRQVCSHLKGCKYSLRGTQCTHTPGHIGNVIELQLKSLHQIRPDASIVSSLSAISVNYVNAWLKFIENDVNLMQNTLLSEGFSRLNKTYWS